MNLRFLEVDVMTHPIAAILENEYYLEKVLFHVVDDGIHDCRQVCRKWNKVCKKLPVRLLYTRLHQVYGLETIFPNVTSIARRRHSFDKIGVWPFIEKGTNVLYLTRFLNLSTWISVWKINS